MNMYAFLRRLCLFCIVRGGIKVERLIWYQRQVCHSYGYDKLRVFSRLEKLGLLSSEIVRDLQKLKRRYGLKQEVLNDEEAETPNDIQFLFPYIGYAFLSVRIVQSALDMDPKRLRTSFASSQISRNSTSIGLRLMKTILVYYIGGVTVAEIAAYRFFNQSQDRYQFKVVTTVICNGTQVLRTL
uniref:Uncharacterized protein AlNc14C193G8500 n=1 Tax=Albugo laibachii Nc14 TaxID=890382 RepID=F0WQ18_9STRA|nr:conserved hypothetical protein [Albugo laibachii Nc14]|eukprot:CCA23423.1 conserved hypothetical protein [Albugo laibachii Nc14]